MLEHDSSILIVGPSWVGDMVMAQSLFMVLKRRQPALAIDVLAPKWSLPLLKRMPQVRDGIALDVAHGELGLLERWRLGKSLRAKVYDHAIVLPRSLKAALVPFFASVPQRTGYKGECRYGLLTDIRAFDSAVLDQTVKRFVALGLPRDADFVEMECPEPRLVIDSHRQAGLIESLGLKRKRKVVGIIPGAEYGPAKQWPTEYYAALIAQLDLRDIEVWILGSQKEYALADALVQQAGQKGVNLCGKTQLCDAIDLIAAADMVVSNDSGLMHVAAAVNTPLIAIYGSSSPRFTPPLMKNAHILYEALDCSPCFKRECPLGHLNCLKQISVNKVLGEMGDLLV